MNLGNQRTNSRCRQEWRKGSRAGLLAGFAGLFASIVASPSTAASAEIPAPNLVPNPAFEGDLGSSLGVPGTVPSLWRAFAVNGATAEVSVVALGLNALFPGSASTRAVRFEATGGGGDRGFDHTGHQLYFTPGHSYRAEVYLRSGNPGGAAQGVSVSFPVFDDSGFTGRQPGSFTVTVDDQWRLYQGPLFQEAAGTRGDVAFRPIADGGSDAVLIAMPTVLGPTPSYPAAYTTGQSFSLTDRYVAASFFIWYSTNGGQLSGPWRPLEGRPAWTGRVPFWRRQLLDVMDAGIDVLYVHLVQEAGVAGLREELFRAFAELRREGYDPPKLAPFLDPVIIWNEVFVPIGVDLATNAGKDELVSHYIRWYEQYFGANQDAEAESYLLSIDSRAGLDTWWIQPPWTLNPEQFTRQDLESRLRSAFPGRELFANGVYLIGTESRAPIFTDERMHQFSNTAYFSAYQQDGKRTATMKAGYWDQNIRDPGLFLARNGGAPYRQAWDDLVAAADNPPRIYHAYIESWNEYDEGTGIYSANPGPPVIAPANQSGNDDTWSETGNPREYIDSTAEGAARFRGDPAHDAALLWSDLPEAVAPGQPFMLKLLVRNEGSAEWSGAAGYSLGQRSTDAFTIGNRRHPVDDGAVETAIYGGAFRGRPVLFEIAANAPATPGSYDLNWQMVGPEGGFGPLFTTTLHVGTQPPCVESATTMCLENDQFEVTGSIVGQQGEMPLQMVELTADTGYGWFLNAQNLEVFIKVLNGCGINGKYWAFFGGLTNLRATLRIRSVLTGQELVKVNPARTNFETESNVVFFDGCPQAARGHDPAVRNVEESLRSRVVGSQLRELDAIAAVFESKPPAARTRAVSEPSTAACVASPTTICLENDQFEVKGTIVGQQGETALQMEELTGDTGYGWFLNAQNLEVFVKVLNGCGINQRYWVFFGGLTNLEARLEVRNTLTGQVLVKSNPARTNFRTESNVAFFEGCG